MLDLLNEYPEAEELLRAEIERIPDERPRKDNVFTIAAMNDLTVLSKEQKRYEEAEPLLLDALEGRRLTLGDTHPHTLESWHNLIGLYEARNKPEEVEKWRAELSRAEAAGE